MANSKLPGPATTHPHHHRHRPHTVAVPSKALPPAKTPGPQGHNDHADPLITTLLGFTPNLTGVRDWADHTLQEVDHLWHKVLGGIGIEKEAGAAVAHGAPPITAPANSLTLDETHVLALRITSVFEGSGAKSMNYKSLAGTGTGRGSRHDPDFDNMATSFGIVQFNFGQGTLGELLNTMRASDAVTFDRCFTADSDYDTLKAALAAKSKAAQMAWARRLYSTPAGKTAWQTSFENVGSVDAFNKVQVSCAIKLYEPIVVKDIAFLRSMAPALMPKVEFRSYAALFDCAIQQGGLLGKKKVPDEIKTQAAHDKPSTQFALMTIALTARAKAANPTSVADSLCRRLSILNGKALTFDNAGKPLTRENPQYSIVLTEGVKTVMGV